MLGGGAGAGAGRAASEGREASPGTVGSWAQTARIPATTPETTPRSASAACEEVGAGA